VATRAAAISMDELLGWRWNEGRKLQKAPVERTVQQRWNVDDDTGAGPSAQTGARVRSPSVHFDTACGMAGIPACHRRFAGPTMHMNDTTADTPPQIWVDADACPVVIRDILFRAAERAQVHVTFVANQWLRTPGSRYIRALQVSGGYDVADDAIAERACPNDLVVTQDIPLAARVVERGAEAIDPRGERFTADNIAERLSMRNFMEELRGAGVQTGGPAALHARDRQTFANQLDRWIAGRATRR